jgi:hypothetical protein
VRSRVCLTLLCLSLALLVTATATAAAVATSPAGFVARANAICAAENTQANALAAPTSAATTVTYLKKTIAIVQHAITAIRALPTPKSDRRLIQTEMNDATKELAAFRQAKAAAASNNPAGYQSDVTAAESSDHAAAAVAKKLGLKSCER